MSVSDSHAATTHQRRRGRGLRVLVAGGGVAGLEALLALGALAGDRVVLHLLSPGDWFVYRPLEVREAFDPDAMVRIDWARILIDRRIGHLSDALRTVDVEQHVVTTTGGNTLPYDVLVLTPGARIRPALAGAVTVGLPGATRALGEVLGELRSGTARHVAFVGPAGISWTVPLYELAMLTADHVARSGVEPRPEFTLVTCEGRPLELFGPEASTRIADMLERRSIRLHTAGMGLTHRSGRLRLDLEDGLPVDRTVALPLLEGPRIAGLRATQDGFLRVDGHGRVDGADDVYAAGDATAFPVKQGGLAAQQADAVAAHIAARAGAQVQPAPFEPMLRGMLLTGGRPMFLRRDLTAGPPGAEVTAESPWWPAAKIVGHHLAPYLARHIDWGARPRGPQGRH
jgi:sulfide:quinone oxidoreductase